MIRKIEVVICDICDSENEIIHNKDDDDYENDDYQKCSLCNKDICSDCCSNIFEDVVTFFPVKMPVCEKCIEGDKLEKELRRFFKVKESKEDMERIMNRLKMHLSKVAMLNSLKDEKEDD